MNIGDATQQSQIIEADLTRSSHSNAVLELLQAYARDAMGAGQPLSPVVSGSLIDALKQHPTTRIFLAEYEQRFIGMAICFVGFSTFHAKPLLNVHDLAVLSDFRGKGIGRALLRAVAEAAAARGYCKVTLEVREDNHNAAKLYASEGFAAGQSDGKAVQYLFLEKRL